MLYKNRDLYRVLGELSVIDKKELDALYAESRTENRSLGEILLARDLITTDNLGKVEADLIGYPYIDLSKVHIPESILRIVPEVVAKGQEVIVFKKDKSGLHLAMVDPTNVQIKNFIEKKEGFPVNAYYATRKDLGNALTLYAKDITQAFEEIIKVHSGLVKKGVKVEPSIIKIVDTIINYAYQNRSSDVHIEPQEEGSVVRFRIDGVLHDIVKIPKIIHPQIVTRVKVLARLRTDEHQAPQDGKIEFSGEEKLDIRVSVVPVTGGEKIVLRILAERSRQFSLHDLGLSNSNLKKVSAAYGLPHGMILATGPTGSGKTTTLYAILKLLNKPDVNIMTIEDPVEYGVERVNQIQVNPKAGLTFATGLRSIVRQDPDIILVGEIRDEETAGIAVNSAMTGHLVLSSLHTNDAATTIPRLLDMGIEPFIVATTVNVIIAQRLVRKICEACRVSRDADLTFLKETISAANLKKLGGSGHQARVYEGKGCEVCHQTGFVGRIGIFEVLVVDDAIRKMILERYDSQTIKKQAVAAGMTTAIEDGIEKVNGGITTLQELLRVMKE